MNQILGYQCNSLLSTIRAEVVTFEYQLKMSKSKGTFSEKETIKQPKIVLMVNLCPSVYENQGSNYLAWTIRWEPPKQHTKVNYSRYKLEKQWSSHLPKALS